MNHLYYGDNLRVMRDCLKDESVDLVYLDPPFNSKRDYNLLFRSPKGQKSEAQITAFEDSWHWGEQAESEYHELLHQANTSVAELVKAFRSFLGENDMMAYLTMMANRLLELRRVLKPTGSLYLHCDPTASHYLKIVLDGVFGKEQFLNELIWKRSSSHNSAKRYGPVHDTIFFYAKGRDHVWNEAFQPLPQSTIDQWYNNIEEVTERRFNRADLTGAGVRFGPSGLPWRGIDVTKKGRHWAIPGFVGELVAGMSPQEALEALDEAGRLRWPAKEDGVPMLKRYLDESKGVPALDVITDIAPLNNSASERLGYPTQKPLSLLERIILSSSNEGDVILDPFCGCGTAVHAAQKLKRQWIGIDITCLAIGLIEKRLKDAFKAACQFEIHGTPKDLESARDLAFRDKYQFQWWAVTLVDAQPYQGKKKGADGGIDGIKFFYDVNDTTEARKIIVSVKGGGLKADDLRALNHVRVREKADIALLISTNPPTAKMKAEAASVGYYDWQAGKKSPRIQLLTVEGLLSGTQRADHPDYTPNMNYKQAKREKSTGTPDLFGGNN